MQRKLNLPYHWLCDWFLRRRTSLELRGRVAWLCEGRQARPLEIKSPESVRVTRGVLFSALTISERGRETVVNGLDHETAVRARAIIHAAFLLERHPQAVALVDRIEAALQNRYVRTSHWQAQQKQLVNRVGSWVTADRKLLDQETRAPFDTLTTFAGWSAGDLDGLRKRYVDCCKERFRGFFESVESNPLTERQRTACIVDEDHNLVLAGAGTGKTSTMVGRAGFLLESGQAKASEILMLAYARKAADEMDTRMQKRLTARGLSAMTFHSLGLKIIGDVENGRPSITPLADDPTRLRKRVDEWFQGQLDVTGYKALVVRYFSRYLRPAINPFDFKTEGEYFESLNANNMRSLKGDELKGYGESLIANFLYRMGVEYQYEARYAVPTRTPDFRDYHPDFFLPAHNIYIEHFGIDRQGNTAPFVDRAKYHAGMAWKRDLHKKHRTGLIETYHYETTDGTLLQRLEERLVQAGVQFDPLPDEAILDDLRQLGTISEFSGLLADLLMRYKANWFTEEELSHHLGTLEAGPQVQAALDLLKPVLRKYEQHLAETGTIDFEDMIGRAVDYVQKGRFRSPWSHILVDEFQDISKPRAKLIKALRDSAPDCSIFCVGDDWQAIYRFTGSDLNFTTRFEEVFGASKITILDKTFRFNDKINTVASMFVMANPEQREKQMQTVAKVDKPAVSLLRQSKTEIDGSIQRVLEKITGQRLDPERASVYLLARYHFTLPSSADLSRYRQTFPGLDIQAMTIHASKGKEADYVIVLGMETGKNGFPSEKQTHPLLEALLPPKEAYLFAEERRLFYVAVTRARHRTYLIADMNCASPFVEELLKGHYPVEQEEFEVSLMQRLAGKLRCYRCGTGIMQKRSGPHGSFMGCSYYPRCSYTEKVCLTCSMPMQRVGNYRLCINPDCGAWTPVCPSCGAAMEKRRGPFGVFWGCTNYRGKAENSCSTTREVHAVHPPTPGLAGPHPSSCLLRSPST